MKALRIVGGIVVVPVMYIISENVLATMMPIWLAVTVAIVASLTLGAKVAGLKHT
jgi:hypothetical protein